jgi:DNA replication protein DnaC
VCGSRHDRAAITSGSQPWSDKLDAIKNKLGTGFLIALLGERGTGKTQMAVELMRHLVFRVWPATEAGTPAAYTSAQEFFLSLRAAYRKSGPSEIEQMAPYVAPDLLVIDEAQERGETEWEQRMLAYVCDKRYFFGLDTLLISNLTPEAFKASIGPSIYSRLIETGGVVVADWPSFRRPQ